MIHVAAKPVMWETTRDPTSIPIREITVSWDESFYSGYAD